MPPTQLPPAARRLLDSPVLPRHLRALQETLDEEAARREQFIDELPPDGTFEFINGGEVIVHPPTMHRHNRVTARLLTLLSTHVRSHGLGTVVAHGLVSLTRNDYEPDVCFFGRAKTDEITPDTLRYPAPDLIAEVLSPSTEKTDRGVKLEDYAAHGVAEYWLFDPKAETVEVYVLDGKAEDGVYALRLKSDHGTLASVAVGGFAVPVRAAFDDATNLDALRALLTA